MKAKVLATKDGISISDGGHSDNFVSPGMTKLIGHVIRVIEKNGFPGWYRGVDVGFNWHKSWLKFQKKETIKKSTKKGKKK
jgi:hypothetical protein